MKLQHIVLIGFAGNADAQAISEAVRRFALLKTLVPDVHAFEWGENCSPEGLGNGHTHAFVLTFGSPEARDAYLIHPDHVAFAGWVKPLVASVTVFDYWATAAAPAGSSQG
jgi:hypothetical protein